MRRYYFSYKRCFSRKYRQIKKVRSAFKHYYKTGYKFR